MRVQIGQRTIGHHVTQGLKGKIRVNRRGAIADEHREVVYFTRLAGFDQERNLGAGPVANQVMVQARSRQQSRNRCHLCVDTTIRNDHDIDATLDRRISRRVKFL